MVVRCVCHLRDFGRDPEPVATPEVIDAVVVGYHGLRPQLGEHLRAVVEPQGGDPRAEVRGQSVAE